MNWAKLILKIILQGEDKEDEDEDITEEVLEIARIAKEKLEAKNKKGKVNKSIHTVINNSWLGKMLHLKF